MTSYFTQINTLPIFDNLVEYIDTLESLWQDNDQICLNAPPEYLDDYTYGIGKLPMDWSGFEWTQHTHDEQIQYMRKHQTNTEKTFNVLVPRFENTPVAEIYHYIKNNFNVGRVRLMRIPPRKVMSWHFDNTLRLHYPIKTSIGCRMVIEEESKHLPANTWWITNTYNHHTAFNGSDDYRIHLVACLLD